MAGTPHMTCSESQLRAGLVKQGVTYRAVCCSTCSAQRVDELTQVRSGVDTSDYEIRWTAKVFVGDFGQSPYFELADTNISKKGDGSESVYSRAQAAGVPLTVQQA